MNSILCQKCYDLFCLINRWTALFPKKERHGLGLALDRACLALIESVIEAEQTKPVLKDRSLIFASVKNEFARILIRLAMERKLIKETNYFTATGLSIEIGKIIGGWRKSIG